MYRWASIEYACQHRKERLSCRFHLRSESWTLRLQHSRPCSTAVNQPVELERMNGSNGAKRNLGALESTAARSAMVFETVPTIACGE